MIKIRYKRTYSEYREHATAYRHSEFTPFIAYSNSHKIRVHKVEMVGYNDTIQAKIICKYILEIYIGEHRLPSFICGFVDHKNKDLQEWRSI